MSSSLEVTHGLFLRFAYRYGPQASTALYSVPAKTPLANAITSCDDLCHITCLWCYLHIAMGGAATATAVGLGLLAAVAVLSHRFHRDETRLAYFVDSLRQGLSAGRSGRS